VNAWPAGLTTLLYLLAATCFILALKAMSRPATARRGNVIGAVGALIAVVTTFLAIDLEHLLAILVAMVIGGTGALVLAGRVRMTAMPQVVALFNGAGGGAAALVGLLELALARGQTATSTLLAVLFTIVIGAISFAGSAVTFAKLQELMTTRPVLLPGQRLLMVAWLVALVVFATALLMTEGTWAGVAMMIVGLAGGLLLVLPVGGADVPIVISLLNAATGLSVAASGFLASNVLLVVAGTLVGASGLILTRAMARAMGRDIGAILFGALGGGSSAGSTAISNRPVRSATPGDLAVVLGYANRVVVVPGYGLAAAQAQHALAELSTTLRARGVEVLFGIHPVAGRMPGHMNVLLAEADIDYELLLDLPQTNAIMAGTDVALVVGANDVVNPAAEKPGTPIYGMPIIDTSRAGQCVFVKRSMRPGFAGIENELLYEPSTTLLFGDAKSALTELVGEIRNL
jgi:proton-translocating NAD(P)+ transhydrogenase subunit beta